jgi:hypothetical protein
MENKTYLIWVGSESYETIDEWCDEAVSQGVSKRIPNANVGASLKEPGTVVFVAHDEGEWRDCPECLGIIENPVWRKKDQQMVRYASEIERFKKERDALASGGDEEEEKEKRKKCDSLNRKIAKREMKIQDLEVAMKDVKERIEGGTGGMVKLARVETANYSEEIVDYRKYDYWYHQPKKFAARWQRIGEPKMCKACGGKGKLPEAKIFGLFVPSAVEYILKAEDNDVVEKEIQERGFRTIPKKQLKVEAQRKCGYRKEGGYYVVTDKDASISRASEIVEKLVSSGFIKPDGVDIKGEFVRFLSPVPVDVKRFRGIKKWEVEEGSDVEEEAVMIMDAME